MEKFFAPHLHHYLISNKELPAEPTRNGFGKGLVEAADADERVVAVCADLAESTRMHWFREKYPNRYIEVGVAEQNLACVGSGLANYGKIPFITSYAAFSPGRNNEQIRTTIALNNVPVKIAGSHAGISVGPDGATHQALEDIGLTRMMPHMTVLSPCDANEAKKATLAAAKHDGPVYIRLAREKTPVFTTKDSPFEIGKAEVLFRPDGELDAAIVATGPLVYRALVAAKELYESDMNVAVINLGTIKPLDTQALDRFAEEAGAIVTVEEHQIAGGMGSAVAECLAARRPVPIEFVGVRDRFGQSGKPDELLREYGMDIGDIKVAVIKATNRK